MWRKGVISYFDGAGNRAADALAVEGAGLAAMESTSSRQATLRRVAAISVRRMILDMLLTRSAQIRALQEFDDGPESETEDEGDPFDSVSSGPSASELEPD